MPPINIFVPSKYDRIDFDTELISQEVITGGNSNETNAIMDENKMIKEIASARVNAYFVILYLFI